MISWGLLALGAFERVDQQTGQCGMARVQSVSRAGTRMVGDDADEADEIRTADDVENSDGETEATRICRNTTFIDKNSVDSVGRPLHGRWDIAKGGIGILVRHMCLRIEIYYASRYRNMQSEENENRGGGGGEIVFGCRRTTGKGSPRAGMFSRSTSHGTAGKMWRCALERTAWAWWWADRGPREEEVAYTASMASLRTTVVESATAKKGNIVQPPSIFGLEIVGGIAQGVMLAWC
ncbi:hypothetical protein PMIN01_06619 [Paraphaeosphaeria minitans]|uniref:Uncharacterized protein n=1 Tax=Paraphaeosphaeria minitans TaxID=565426 RepID=A0A9P6GJB1_9PLEO|nr:hypothetical protein PMIN01_06619 [Paraphaeosphaeria minitans]